MIYNIHIIYTVYNMYHIISYIYIYIYIYTYVYIHLSYVYTFCSSIHIGSKKGKISNWALQFLKDGTKTFLVLQNIFYSLHMKVSTAEWWMEGYKMCEVIF